MANELTEIRLRQILLRTAEERHRVLDLLVAGWIADTSDFPSETSVLELLQWSHGQVRREGIHVDKAD